MPPTRTARKSTRGNTTVADAPGATLKSTFKAVGKNKGLKSSKNVGSAPSIAVGGEKPSVARKSELIGVVVEEKKTTVKKSVERNEESNVGKGRGRGRGKNAGAKKLKGGFEENKMEEVVEEVVAVVEGENEGNPEKGVERVESTQNTVVDVVEKQEEVVIEVEEKEEVPKNVGESTEKPLKKLVEALIVKSSKSTKATRGNKRKATEIEVGEGRKEAEKIFLKAKESSAPEIITSEPKSIVEDERPEDAQPQIRARKRTRVQKETPTTTTESTKVILDEIAAVELPLETGDDSDYAEASAKGKASKTPRNKAPLKPKTPRSTRNATLLSIAASTLGQTTLSIPPAQTTSLSTVSATVEPDSEVTLSSLNTLLLNTSKEKGPGDKKRPTYLQQLANLHAHLLTAIHLHHAQNGMTSLPDFKGLKPHLERLSKRTVELADLRKICWLTNYDPDKIPIVEIDKIEKGEAAQVEEVEVPKKGRKGKKAAPKKVKAKVKQEDEGKELKNSRKGWLKTVDYGSGKIVLELVLSMAGVGEVNNLRREFERKIDAFWTEKGVQEEEEDQEKEVEIPMAEIIVSENKKMVDTVLKAKGQRRLLEMKGVQVLRGTGKGLGDEPFLSMKKPVVGSKTSGDTVPSPVSTITKAQKPAVEEVPFAPTSASSSTLPSSTPAPQDKKLSLLDRIRAKHQASLLAASQSPTASISPEEIASNHARVCAQQRLPEIIPILRSLRLRASGGGIGGAGTGRKSMSLEEVIVGIRQSVRTGITKEQAELCIRLIGEQKTEIQKEKQQGLSGDGGLGGKVAKERGKGGLLGSWGQKDEVIAGNGRKDERGWVEVVECGGVKAVVFM